MASTINKLLGRSSSTSQTQSISKAQGLQFLQELEVKSRSERGRRQIRDLKLRLQSGSNPGDVRRLGTLNAPEQERFRNANRKQALSQIQSLAFREGLVSTASRESRGRTSRGGRSIGSNKTRTVNVNLGRQNASLLRRANPQTTAEQRRGLPKKVTRTSKGDIALKQTRGLLVAPVLNRRIIRERRQGFLLESATVGVSLKQAAPVRRIETLKSTKQKVVGVPKLTDIFGKSKGDEFARAFNKNFGVKPVKTPTQFIEATGRLITSPGRSLSKISDSIESGLAKATRLEERQKQRDQSKGLERAVRSIDVGASKFLISPKKVATQVAFGFGTAAIFRTIGAGIGFTSAGAKFAASQSGELGTRVFQGSLGATFVGATAIDIAKSSEPFEEVGKIPFELAAFTKGASIADKIISPVALRKRVLTPGARIQQEADIQRTVKTAAEKGLEKSIAESTGIKKTLLKGGRKVQEVFIDITGKREEIFDKPQQDVLRNLAKLQRGFRNKKEKVPIDLTSKDLPSFPTKKQQQKVLKVIAKDETSIVFGSTVTRDLRQPGDIDLASSLPQNLLKNLAKATSATTKKTQSIGVAGGKVADVKPIERIEGFGLIEPTVKSPSGQKFTRRSEQAARKISGASDPSRISKKGSKDLDDAIAILDDLAKNSPKQKNQLKLLDKEVRKTNIRRNLNKRKKSSKGKSDIQISSELSKIVGRSKISIPPSSPITSKLPSSILPSRLPSSFLPSKVPSLIPSGIPSTIIPSIIPSLIPSEFKTPSIIPSLTPSKFPRLRRPRKGQPPIRNQFAPLGGGGRRGRKGKAQSFNINKFTPSALGIDLQLKISKKKAKKKKLTGFEIRGVPF